MDMKNIYQRRRRITSEIFSNSVKHVEDIIKTTFDQGPWMQAVVPLIITAGSVESEDDSFCESDNDKTKRVNLMVKTSQIRNVVGRQSKQLSFDSKK
ncbi:hypothetical protein FQA39_LY09649 [Lamprigera yunnana]|nr:hypothetical protein FQA39_LY09649 [Lamprigera yunnana]